MSHWSSYPFVRIVFCFVFGCLLYPFIELEITTYIFAILVGLLYLGIFLKGKGPRRGYSWFPGFLMLTLCIFMGMLRMEMGNITKDPHHLINHQFPEKTTFFATIETNASEKEKYLLYTAKIKWALPTPSQTKNQQEEEYLHAPDFPGLIPLCGKVHLYVLKDSTAVSDGDLSYGMKIVTNKKPRPIAKPANPHEFDYSDYMMNKGITHQLFLKPGEFLITHDKARNDLFGWSLEVSEYLQNVLKSYLKKESSQAIALALTLGIKDGLDQDLKESYASAGAMHVLAVSGLHVGIIYMILKWLLGFLRKRKLGKVIFLCSALSTLWIYAFITGFSPSVLRAALMFSLVLIGQHSLRNQNIYNSLAISALIILLFDPHMLQQVGFQLSYLAVIGIVYLHPKIYGLLSFKYRFFDYLWSITCVSIAAQVATFPIGLFYFHQFPTYFLFSNLLVIPAAYAILLGSIFLWVLHLLVPTLAELLAKCLDCLIELVNTCITFFNQLPFNKIDWVSIHIGELLIIYGIIICLIMLIYRKSAKYLKITFVLSLLFSTISCAGVIQNMTQTQVVFYKTKKNGAIDFIDKGTVSCYLREQVDLGSIQFNIEPNRIINSLPPLKEEQLNKDVSHLEGVGDLIIWKGLRIVILTEPVNTRQIVDKVACNFLVLSKGFSGDAASVGNLFNFDRLVLDSSFSWYEASSLSKRLSEHDIDHWNINEQGALVYEM